MIRATIDTLVRGHSLSQEEAAQAMNEIMEGEATPAQIAAFITELWHRREDRYSQIRSSQTLVQPRIEMSYIGG